MKYEVLKLTNQPIFSTNQDEGRIGFEQFGVPNSGSGDKMSFRLGNLLMNNVCFAVCFLCSNALISVNEGP